VQYVDSCSAIGDLTIVMRTVGQVLRRHGINGEGEVTMSEFMGSGDRERADG
jgi:hypothetical protein